jgi:hypothetical protein
MHYHNATCFGHIRPSSGNTLFFIKCPFAFSVYREYRERKGTLDAHIKKISTPTKYRNSRISKKDMKKTT